MGVVTTGQITITDLTDGLNLALTKDVILVPSDESGGNLNLSQSSTIAKVFSGGVDVTNKWTISASFGAGVSGTFTDNTFSLTGLTQDRADVIFTANRPGQSTLTTTLAISKVKKGQEGQPGENGDHGLTVVLTNESHTLSADNNGVVSSYTNSGTSIHVYEGTTELDAISGAGSNGSFSIGTPLQSPTNTLTVGARSYSGKTGIVAQHSAMVSGTDSVVITYPITIRRADGTIVTLNRTQSITKSKQGAQGVPGAPGSTGSDGTNAKVVKLVGDITAVSYNSEGLARSVDTINFVATPQNVNIPFYQFYVNDLAQGAGPTSTNTFNYPVPSSYFISPVSIEVEVREGSISGQIVARDEVTIYAVKDGKDVYTVILSNEAHTVPTDSAGSNGNFAGSGTEIRVYQGSTLLTFDGDSASSYPTTAGRYKITRTLSNLSGPNMGGIGTPVATQGNYTAMTADIASASFAIRIRNLQNVDVASITKTQTLGKSKQGTPGAQGSPGQPGNRGSVHLFKLITGSVWSDAEANALFAAGQPANPLRVADRVTLYNSSAGFSQTRAWTGSAWEIQTEVLDGNLLVTKSVTAAAINTEDLYAQNVDVTGSIRVGNDTNYVQLGGNTFIRAQAGQEVLFSVPKTGRGLLQGAGLVPGSILPEALSSAAIQRIRDELGGLVPEFGGTQSISQYLQSGNYPLSAINSDGTGVEVSFFHLGAETFSLNAANPSVTLWVRRGSTLIHTQTFIGTSIPSYLSPGGQVYHNALPIIDWKMTDTTPGTGSIVYSVYVIVNDYPGGNAGNFTFVIIQSASGGDVVAKWDFVQNKPETATRWPAFNEVSGKPTFYPANRLQNLSSIEYGRSGLQWLDQSGIGGSGTHGAAPSNPTNDWWHHLILNHANSAGYYVDIAACFHSDSIAFRRNVVGNLQPWRTLWHEGNAPATATRWPTWSEVSGKPSSFATNWASISDKPDTATRWPTLSEIGALGNSGSQIISKAAHTYGAADYHLELQSPSGSGPGEVSLRFHQGNYYYGQIRFRGDGFHFTNGDSGSYGYAVRAGSFGIGGTAATITGGANGSFRLNTASGWVEIGSQNSGFIHFASDGKPYYFSHEIQVNGVIRQYGTAWAFGNGVTITNELRARHVDGGNGGGGAGELFLNAALSAGHAVRVGSWLVATSRNNDVMARYVAAYDQRGRGQLAPWHYGQDVSYEFLESWRHGSIPASNYSGSMVFRPYGTGTDWSGGPAHKLVFADTGNLYHSIGNASGWINLRKIVMAETDGSVTAIRFSNKGFLGSGQGNAANHFTQTAAGTSSINIGWIAAAFGDASNNRVIIGQAAFGSGAIIGAHGPNLDTWANLTYMAHEHRFYDPNGAESFTITQGGNVIVKDRILDQNGVKFMKWSDFTPDLVPTQEFIDQNGLHTTDMDIVRAKFISAGVLNANLIATKGLNVADGDRRVTFHPQAALPIHFEKNTGTAQTPAWVTTYSVNKDGVGFFTGGLAKDTVDAEAIQDEAKKAINPRYLGGGERRQLSAPTFLTTTSSTSVGSNLTPSLTTLVQGDRVFVQARFQDSQTWFEGNGAKPTWQPASYTLQLQRSVNNGSTFSNIGNSKNLSVVVDDFRGRTFPGEPYEPGYMYYAYDTSLSITDILPSTSDRVVYRVQITRVTPTGTTSAASGPASGLRLVSFSGERSAFNLNEIRGTTAKQFIDKDVGFSIVTETVTMSGNTTRTIYFPTPFVEVYGCTLGWDANNDTSQRIHPRYRVLTNTQVVVVHPEPNVSNARVTVTVTGRVAV